MSNLSVPGVFIELAYNSNAFFEGCRKGDVCIRTAQSNQALLFGTKLGQPAIFGIDGSNIIMRGNIAVGGQTSNPLEALDIRNGNAYFDSNVYVMNSICVGGTGPTERLEVRNGNTLLGSNLYVIGSATIGVSDSNPTETLDIGSNLKVRSNAYVMSRASVGKSNPTEALDVNGSLKVSSNIYALSNISIGSSNPTERLDVSQNAIVRSNAYVLRRVAIGSSNPTEALDIIGNQKVSGLLYALSGLGVGTSNPTERMDVYDNTKLRGDVYALSKMVIGNSASNPAETLDIRGNTKVSSNLYVVNNEGIGLSNPSERLDINGNAKVQSNMYVVNRIGVGASNPSEKVDVSGNVIASGNVYAMNRLGVGTSFPGERVEVTGNIKSLSNVYIINSLAIGHSNPSEKIDVVGNAKVTGNLYVTNQIAINTSNPQVGFEVNTTDSILLPKGTTAQRPATPALGHVRYNTDTSQFEGFGAGSAWGSLGGVKSTNQQTYISAEQYPTSNDDNIRFINSNQETVRITRQGFVGIGTSNPEVSLDVNGLFRFQNQETGTSIFYRSNDQFNGVELVASYTGNEMSIGIDPNNNGAAFVKTYGRTSLVLSTNDTERVMIDNFGNVGIGTSLPQYVLDVNGSISATGYCNLLLDDTGSESTSNAPTANALKLAADAAFYTSNALFLSVGGSNSTSVAGIAASASNTASWSSNNLVKKSGDTMTGTLYTPYIGVNNASATERLDITGNTKVSSNLYVMSKIGVNTSNPSQALHVVGNMRLEGNLDVNGIYNTINTDVQLTDQFTVSNNGTGPALKVYQMGAQPVADFYDDTTLAMRIADGGSVGIGTSTPSELLDVTGNMKARNNLYVMSNLGVGTSNPSYKLDVTGTTRITSNIGQSSGVPLLQLQNGSSNMAFLVNLPGGNYNGCVAAGDHAILAGFNSIDTGSLVLGNWGNSNAGIRIDKSGFVGIGTASPAYKLDVNGTVNATAYTGATITSLSNLGMFGSNTAVSASNTTISLSNYVYGTSTSSSSWASNAAVFGSNTSVSASNTAVWSSNNLFNKNNSVILQGNQFLKVGSIYRVDEYNGGADRWFRLCTLTSNTNTQFLHLQNVDASRVDGYTYYNYLSFGSRIHGYLPKFNYSRLGGGSTHVNVYANTSNQYEAWVFCQSFTFFKGDINFQGVFIDTQPSINNTWTSAPSAGLTYMYSTASNAPYTQVDPNTGYLGIAMSNPSYQLDVTGNVRVANTSALGILLSNNNSPYIQIHGSNASFVAGVSTASGTHSSDAAAGDVVIKTLPSGTTGRLILQTGSTSSSIVINSNNTVGIGTTTPVYKLDVLGKQRLSGNVTSQNTGPRLQIDDFDGTEDTTTYGIVQVTQNSAGTSTYSNQACLSFVRSGNYATGFGFAKGANTFGIGGAQGPTANFSPSWLSITSGGNVGIGTTTPSYLLDVNGNMNATTIYQGGNTLASTYMSFQNAGILSNALTIQEQTGSAGSASGGTLTLKHRDSGGSSSIVFTSTVNAGSDYAYIKYSDQDISTYFTDQTGTTECSRLTIGVENDNLVNNGETIVIKGQYGIAYDSSRHYFTGGNVSIGSNDAAGYKLYVKGQIYATDDITAFSDITAKSNLEIIKDPLTKVAQLNGYTYDMTLSTPSETKITQRYTGIVAQDLEKVLPEAVHKDTSGKLSVAYGNMAGLFVECIKELTQENKSLKEENQQLKSQLESLASKVSNIEYALMANIEYTNVRW